MSLRISLKPHERMILGGVVIHNGPNKADFVVENKVPVLRQKNILSSGEADTPAKRIYFVIQLMYVDSGNIVAHHKLYWELVRDFISAAPSSLNIIDQVNECIVQDRYYDALKLARNLINFEQEISERAKQCCQGLSNGAQGDHVWTRDRSTRADAGSPQAH